LQRVSAPQSLPIRPMTETPRHALPYRELTRPPEPPTSSQGSSATRSESHVATTLETEEVTSLQIQQCCEALAEAEKAGKLFIALTWFRDNGLTAHSYSWAESPAHRRAVLTKAIDVGAIVTASIPNPKAPQHPTTTVKLNRESEYAQAVTPRFQPIRARGGASASEIVIRDRGRS
jgi:hypothetical protein